VCDVRQPNLPQTISAESFVPKFQFTTVTPQSFYIYSHWCFFTVEVVRGRMQPGYTGRWPAILRTEQEGEDESCPDEYEMHNRNVRNCPLQGVK